MQLKQLKLAGFKSFVDPTTIPFPSQLVAIVGPNGCGKSNIIDAVRWVTGESSAKNLRGESMADVIFNGSSQRKPVGQASVELVFDNSLGRLGGQYATYPEISVKRVVTRDGESSYYLNGTRCRRRDIIDIFLGTGAGARGYSIIGQGTISRIVEARPEELRIFLEEAAGISKYKDRRRETLNRIEHTQENLLRVADLCDELGNQLQRLERQAKTAERYQQLKIEEKQQKVYILALKWQKIEQEQQALKQHLMQATLDYEQQQSLITQQYAQVTSLRSEWEAANDHSHNCQADFYKLGTDIALLEENIQQQAREKQRLQHEQQRMQVEWQTITDQMKQDQLIFQEAELLSNDLREKRQELTENSQEHQQAFLAIQQQQQAWQADVQTLEKTLTAATQAEQVAQLRAQHLQQQRQDKLIRSEKIHAEIQKNQQDAEDLQMDELTTLLNDAERQLKQHEDSLETEQAKQRQLRQQISDVDSALQETQEHYHQLTRKETQLNAYIQAVVGGQGASGANPEIIDKQRLMDELKVTPVWRKACETIFAGHLTAYVVDDLASLLPSLSLDEAFSLCTLQPLQTTKSQGLPRLIDQIKGSKPSIGVDLKTIITAETFSQARQWRDQLQANESIITPEGYWLGKDWLRIPGENNKQMGLLNSQAELNELQPKLLDVQQHIDALKNQKQQLVTSLEQQETQIITSQKLLISSRDQYKSYELSIKHKQHLLHQQQDKLTQLTVEKEELLAQIETITEQQLELDTTIRLATEAKQVAQLRHTELLNNPHAWQVDLPLAQQLMDKTRVALQQTELQLEKQQLIMQQSRKTLERDNNRLLLLTDQLEATAASLEQTMQPDAELSTTLTEKLAQHQALNTQLQTLRENLERIHSAREQVENKLKEDEKLARDTQEGIQTHQLKQQTLLVQANNLLESLTELDAQIDVVLSTLPIDAELPVHEAYLVAIVEKINRLGAINLAAIEEYTHELQRKTYLDEQHQDLTDALKTLQLAIEKMDRETKQRLQTTFDEVNSAFQSLFPRLFGGGRAMLELTSDNLLEAGVLVMAQPPGKRNSTIHLLSGGEKAMTAVALVFAIFQLNPSPFCMLDEVDAPLDDTNVGRFCALVKEMSPYVQFLFITHNKITMELAEHLIGVTMHEPGVSRMVAVDVEQALALAEE